MKKAYVYWVNAYFCVKKKLTCRDARVHPSRLLETQVGWVYEINLATVTRMEKAYVSTYFIKSFRLSRLFNVFLFFMLTYHIIFSHGLFGGLAQHASFNQNFEDLFSDPAQLASSLAERNALEIYRDEDYHLSHAIQLVSLLLFVKGCIYGNDSSRNL